MWDLIVSVPDHCLSFYFETKICILFFFSICKKKIFDKYFIYLLLFLSFNLNPSCQLCFTAFIFYLFLFLSSLLRYVSI